MSHLLYLQRTTLRFLSVCTLALAAGCTTVGLAALNLPSRFNSTQIAHNIPYGSHEWETADIYIPPHRPDEKLDVVVFFYGGRWEAGKKEDYRFAGSALASQHFIVVIPDYRKYPAVKFPAFVEDGVAAVAWTYDNIAHYGGNPARLHLAGHSAGAHIGALLAANPAYLAALGKDRNKVVHDFAGLAGPYSFTPDAEDLKAIFGPPPRYPQMQVTTYIDGRQPPMLLQQGSDDSQVEPYNRERLAAAIAQKGGCVKQIIYPGLTHVSLVTALSWYRPGDPPVVQDMVNFFRRKDAVCP